jgi:hypothetical protein
MEEDVLGRTHAGLDVDCPSDSQRALSQPQLVIGSSAAG